MQTPHIAEVNKVFIKTHYRVSQSDITGENKSEQSKK